MVHTSVFDLFKIGIGPSSSHTVGPMVAARTVALDLRNPTEIRVELHGSLALTGAGHGTNSAIIAGLQGYQPDSVPIEVFATVQDELAAAGSLTLPSGATVPFSLEDSIARVEQLHPAHANVMRFVATDQARHVDRWFASTGGGFVVELVDGELRDQDDPTPPPIEYRSARELLELVAARNGTIADVVLENELAFRNETDVRAGVAELVAAMNASIDAGMAKRGTLPGLGVRRRAAELSLQLIEPPTTCALPPTGPSDWAGVYATAVNEENAAGGRIVTAPTNGAAGILPAVLRFMDEFCEPRVEDPELVYMLTASGIGSVIKANAGISGAELGCQGEVGSACAMAAAGLTAALGGTPAQVENAAEIALEHNLGLTCDPVGGFVQIPCIERNAVGAVKAITASSLALRGDGTHMVHLDVAIETMRQTGIDMNYKYKETSLGGLAVNVPAC
jgi:L-serine dehydratase